MAADSENGVGLSSGENGNPEGREGGPGDLGTGGPGHNGPRRRGRTRQGGLETPERQVARSDGRRGNEGGRNALADAAYRAAANPGLADPDSEARWPHLFETLNRTKDINGDDCEPGGFTVTAKGGKLATSFRSPAYNVRVSIWSTSLGSILDDLEAALKGGDATVLELKKHVGKKFRQGLNKA